MRPAVLQTHDNLFDFFHEEVDAAADAAAKEVSEEGVFYLSNLLVEQTRTPDADTPRTLAELHIQAAGSDRIAAIRSYRTLGDKALYTAGFFPESLSRKAVRASYYVDMGRSAYDRLARMLEVPRNNMLVNESGHKDLAAIFAELAESFFSCTEILREVHEAMRARTAAKPSQTALLKLYEDWLITGNRHALRQLQRHGLAPAMSSSSETT
jgi:hypothetical protein